MSELWAGSVLRRRADVRYRVIDEEGVVVRQSAGEVLVLNETATRILALADGAAPVAAWVDTMLAEFEVGRQDLERDVLAFAAELVEQGLLEPVPSQAAVPTAGAASPAAAGGDQHDARGTRQARPAAKGER
jgi:hypothetical protein